MQYTPSTNTDPTKAVFGERSPGVLAYQQNLNRLYTGRAGFTPLLEDGLYGPLTQAASKYQPTNPGIVSSTNARNDLALGGNKLDELNSQQDPYMEYLQKKAQDLIANPTGPGTEEKNIANESAKLKTKTEKDFNAYKAGLETLGIQSGLSQYAPGLQADKMINAENAETEKLSIIQDKENLAMAKAKEARLNKDSVALKETLSEIKSLRAEKRQAIQDQLSKRTQDITVANGIASYINQNLSKIKNPKDKEEYINRIAMENDIDIFALHAALIKDTRSLAKKSGSGGGHYTATNIPSSVAKSLQTTLANNLDKPLTEFFTKFPEVSTSYLTSLYNAYHPTSGIVNPFQ